MAMLAEPRRKQKLSHNPRGNQWSNDDNKFGQKLMEKMGWSKGKGLGAKLHGTTDHVRVALKSDNLGVGCSKNHADNWIAHQDDFNDLLSSLNKDHTSSEAEPFDRVISLEMKSKTSKSRVHYQKFTQGKDLSLKSATDLDCVFGKRKAKSSGDTTPQSLSEVNSDALGSDDDGKPLHGVVTVRSTDSIQEYFAKKMAELKKNQNAGKMVNKEDNSDENMDNANESSSSDEVSNVETENNSESKKKKKKRTKDVSFTLGEEDESCDSIEEPEKKRVKFDANDTIHLYNVDVSDEEIMKKSKKKKKKSKKRSENGVQILNVDIEKENSKNVVDEVSNGCNVSELSKPKKKKKKSKKKELKEEVTLPDSDVHEDRTTQDTNEIEEKVSESETTVDQKTRKKKKGKKNKKDTQSEEKEDLQSNNSTEKTGTEEAHVDTVASENSTGSVTITAKPKGEGLIRDPTRGPTFDKPICDAYSGSNLSNVMGYFGSKSDWHFAKRKLDDKKANNFKNRIEKGYQGGQTF